jgi:hypothetical protein
MHLQTQMHKDKDTQVDGVLMFLPFVLRFLPLGIRL